MLMCFLVYFFFKQKTAYEMRISDGSSDVCSSDRGNGRTPYDVDLATDPDVVVHRISGAFFFGAAANVGAALDRIGEHPKAYVIDFSAEIGRASCRERVCQYV